MRYLFLFTILGCLGGTTTTLAQDDVFAGIEAEPRSAEYLHWNANSYREFKSDLEQQLEDGSGIFDTLFTYSNALPRADHRAHDVQIIYRSGYTQPEIHTNKWDIYVILDGSGTARIGGERVNFRDDQPQAGQTPQLAGAEEFQVTVGDMLHVPARVWHQMVTEPGESITYALINVIY